MLVNTTTFLASQVRNSLSATAQSTNALYLSLKSSLGLTAASTTQQHQYTDQHHHSQEVEQLQQRLQSQSRPHAQYPSLQSPWRGLLTQTTTDSRIKQNYEYAMPVVSSCYSAPRHPIVLCHGKQAERGIKRANMQRYAKKKKRIGVLFLSKGVESSLLFTDNCGMSRIHFRSSSTYLPCFRLVWV
jgi:hypothetical protein